MKLLVKPTSEHGYLDSSTRCEIQPFRPSVVESSYFLTTLFGVNKLKLISNQLVEEATDEEFAKFFSESGRDEELAVSSFMSKFGIESTFEHVAYRGELHEMIEADAAEAKAAKEKAEAEAQADADLRAAAEKAAADAKAAAEKEAAEKAEAAAKSKAQKANEKAKE